MYLGLGLLVTSRWMSCRAMNGPTLGWLKMQLIASSRSLLALAAVTAVPFGRAGRITPLSSDFAPGSCRVGKRSIGAVMETGDAPIAKTRPAKKLAPASA